jgi:hypothetical protein
MGILSKFLIFFGGAFLGLGVILFSYLRKRIAKHSKREKRRKMLEKQKKQLGGKINNIFKLKK